MHHSHSGLLHAHASPAENRHRQFVALAVVLVGALLSLALFLHQDTWWPLPLALAVAHLAVGMAGVVWMRHVVGGHSGGSGEAVGALLHRPRVYDWLVRLILLGGEGRFRRRILDLAEVRPGDAVLDVGCGTGTLLVMAAERVGPGGRLAGVEPSPEMLARARDRAESRQQAVDLRVAPANALPFEDGSFDVVFCTLVLHHVPEEARAESLAEMRRVLRPGGRLVVADLEGGSAMAGLSLVGLLHGLASDAGPSQVAAAVRILENQDYERVTVHGTGTSAVRAIVASVGVAPVQSAGE